MIRILSLAAVLLSAPASAANVAAPDAKPYGILLLAHGGEKGWDAEIEGLRVRVDSTVPTEVAIGMADPATLQAGIDKLAARGVQRVIAVPLFIHSRSEILDQTAYALGLSDKPSEVLRAASERMKSMPMPPGMPMMNMFSLDRVKTSLPIAMTPALDDSSLVSNILLERAKALSLDPKTETVVLVAHGPVDDAAIGAWNGALAKHAEFVLREGGFLGASFALLRDDAAPRTRARRRQGRPGARGPGADRARRDREQASEGSRRPEVRLERRHFDAARRLRRLGTAARRRRRAKDALTKI
jgi:hypothetical protein